MNDKEIKALISLLDDEDMEVKDHVESKLMSLGSEVIPLLETEWENNFNPKVQARIEEMIHSLQFDALKARLSQWYQSEEKDLLEGMWIVATYQYPDLEISKLKNEIEQIFYDAWVDFKKDLHPLDQIKVLNNVIFNKLKFAANTKNFHSPGNSMLNVVLESKRGNPISLCVIYLLVAQKLNMPVYGVNLPNLFILTYKNKDYRYYINAFNKGLIFSKSDIDQYLNNLHLNQLPIFYEPCTHVDIIRRVLRNLSVSFENMSDYFKSDEVKQLLKVVEAEESQSLDD